jgi:hypothetical protein
MKSGQLIGVCFDFRIFGVGHSCGMMGGVRVRV